MKTTPQNLLLMTVILLGAISSAAQTEIAATVTTASPFTPILTIEDCTFPDLERKARCGTLTIAEDPQHPDGRKVDLHLVVLPAASGEPGSDAVTYLVGGPGQAATTMVGFFGDSLRGIQEHHDLVLVDQRGTGRSNPLDCEFAADEVARAVFGGSISAAKLEACRAGLDADPALYTTPIAMDDLEAVRAALGYERFHLIGVSYGSRAALVYLRRHPERVASIVLRGVASPADNIPHDWLRSGEEAMADLLARCAADAACDTAFPHLQEHLSQTLTALESRPRSIAVEARGADRSIELTVTPDFFAGSLHFALYSDRSAAMIPSLIDHAARGDFEPFTQGVAQAFLATSQRLHFGMYLSVLCAEDVPFLDLDGAKQESWSFQNPALLAHLVETCRGWPQGTVPDGYKQPVASTIPALLLSGATDPATSPHRANGTARHLPNSRHLITPGLGHHPSWTSCFANATAALINGTPIDQIDATCAEEKRTSDFVVPISHWVWVAVGVVGVGLVVLLGLWRWRRRSGL